MSNILGLPFKPYVKKQIETRQKVLGKNSSIKVDDLKYYTTSTPFLRLASSVNIDPNIENSIINSFKGINVESLKENNLAKTLILQGGSLSLNEESNFQGLNKSYNNLNENRFNAAYGWGNFTERGQVPMPGIIDASINYLNNGALARTIINLKAYNSIQFEIIDALYLRPSYTLLLEYGHSVYIDNNENLQTWNNFNTKPLSTFLNPELGGPNFNHYKFSNIIEETKEKYNGNYGASFGVIQNFNWNLNNDGTYDIQIRMIGLGSIIESLKLNIVKPDNSLSEEKVQSNQQPSSPGDPKNNSLIINAKNKTVLHNILYEISQGLNFQGPRLSNYEFNDYIINNFKNIDNNGNLTNQNITFKNAIFSIVNASSEQYKDFPKGYITLGTLLALIESRIFLYNDNVPLVTFDIDYLNIENDDNFITRFPGQFSSNPEICLIPYNNTNLSNSNFSLPINIELNKILNEKNKYIADVYLGRLSHILVNLNYILKVLDQTKSQSNGDISVLKFLNNLFEGITKALGGINNFRIIYDSVKNKIRIFEEIPQRFVNLNNFKPNNEEYTKINTIGLLPGQEGNFVKNIGLNSNLSNNFASLIAIGAQSQGSSISGNSTAFSNYNRGLIDRIIPTKTNYYDTPSSGKFNQDLANLFNKSVSPLLKNVYENLQFSNSNISTLESYNLQYSKQVMAELVNSSQLTSPFFIPFILELTLQGISGIKLYEKFLIDNKILPPAYRNQKIDLIVRSITDNISISGWETIIASIGSPNYDTKSVPPNEITFEIPNKQELDNILDDELNLTTITNSIPINEIYYQEVSNKKQIYLHHTAGKSIQSTLDSWNSRTDKVSTTYIIGKNGEEEQVYENQFWSNHLGIPSSTFQTNNIPYRNLNKTSIGIELVSLGPIEKRGDKFYSLVTQELIPESRVARPIDSNGNFISYKGAFYYEKYTDAQIIKLQNRLTDLIQQYNIPFKYSYNILFPQNRISTSALSLLPGIYTHNSVRIDKSDIFPQLELILMLQSISL